MISRLAIGTTGQRGKSALLVVVPTFGGSWSLKALHFYNLLKSGDLVWCYRCLTDLRVRATQLLRRRKGALVTQCKYDTNCHRVLRKVFVDKSSIIKKVLANLVSPYLNIFLPGTPLRRTWRSLTSSGGKMCTDRPLE